MFKQIMVVDVTETTGKVRKAFDDFVFVVGCGNGSYFHFMDCDIEDNINDCDDPEVREGWLEVLTEMKSRQIKEFGLHYWW